MCIRDRYAADGLTPGTPFPNNTIPANLLSANAQALLTAGGKYGGIFPAANNGNNFQGGNNSPTNVREEIVRIDHQFTDKFSIFGHWISEQISQGYGTTQWSGDNVPSVGDTFGNPSYSAVIHATYVISPTLILSLIHISPHKTKILAPSSAPRSIARMVFCKAYARTSGSFAVKAPSRKTG